MDYTNSLEYFAAIPQDQPDQLANAMTDKINTFRKWYDSRGFTALQKKKLVNYYGNSMGGNSSMAVVKGGSEGELSLIKVNDFRQLIQEQLVVVTSQRPAGIAKAINSNTAAQKSAKIGTALAENYMSQFGFEKKFVSAAEIALVNDESFVEIAWDQSKGDPIGVDPDTGLPEMSGDGVLNVHCPWNVARDIGAKCDTNAWYIITSVIHKFDAAVRYEKFADHIISCTDDAMTELELNKIPDGSDEIYQHLLIHDRTPSVPNGRYSLMIGGKIVLDAGLPFKDFPAERLSGSDVIDGNVGYAAANDMLALEEVTDALHSVMTTNSTTFGGQCLVGPEGSNLKVSDLAKGVRYFELPPDQVGLLRALDLLHTPPEVPNYINMLTDKKGKAVGSVSGILAAQAQQGASGNSMALIQTQAISFNSGTQRSYYGVMSSVMTKFIGVLRVYADTPRVASIVGKSKSAGLKEFKYTGKDLGSISSVVYEIVNPLFQTYGGRLTAAQDLLKAGQIKSPKQFINLAATGQPDVLDQDDEADGMLIMEENEWLAEGKPFDAIITQMHADHIKSHTSQITLEMQVNDPQAVARILSHIQQHIDVWVQASINNPGILMATGQQPLKMPPGMMPQGAPMPGAPEGIPKISDAESPAQQKAGAVKMPGLPNVAGTREKPQVPGVTDAVGAA